MLVLAVKFELRFKLRALARRGNAGCPMGTGPFLKAACVAASILASASPIVAGDADEKGRAATAAPLNFEDDIVPILEVRCFRCHGAETRKAGLDLRRRFSLTQGGDSGPAVAPGKPDESLLIELIEKKEMPPKDEDPLDARQIDLLRRWVAAGAPIKGTEESALETADSDNAVSDDDRNFWAFRPPKRPDVPAIKAKARVANPIDAFLLEKLEFRGLSFNREAGRLVLLRRVYFDLVGLPPPLEEIDAFLADDSADAYERLVTRLLDSPQYGERWARHWLDVVGYAESDGYLDADRERPEAWRYRDYVIRALNSDKPYDQFIREQIAGDELSDWRGARELTGEMADQLIATGFLRTASDPTYGGYKEKPEIYKVLADTVQIVGSTFLGVTIQCARCHEHKSEPISQRDYYQLQAVLAGALDPERWLASAERSIPLATDAQLAVITAHNKAISDRVAQLNAEIVRLLGEHRDRLFEEKLPQLAADLKESLKAALLVAADKRTAEQQKLVADHAPNVVIDDGAVFARFTDLKGEVEKIRAAIAAEAALSRPVTQLRGLVDLEGKPAETFVLRRGDFNNKGKAVDSGVPAVLAPSDFRLQPVLGPKSSGRRLALARWLTDAGHPLTARLHVNRLWAWHFGKGIVETLDDFGHTGKLPSHPELLDWLACEFAAQGYRQKAIHRLIVTSTAYRQATTLDASKAAIDAENTWLWAFRPKRHEGEVLRDALLAASGKLNLQMFGPAVAIVRQPDGSVVSRDGALGNRRSIYLQVRRSQPVTLTEAFDAPKMEINCTRRTEAIVATQALALMNSPFAESSAQAISARIIDSSSQRDARIDFAFRLLLARSPTASERRSLATFLDALTAAQIGQSATAAQKQAAEDAAWRDAALALFNTNEFLFVD
ncbi:MAG TPA: PSD1 and planctomycete cytochrome C domain-containing protein [Planctomycetaceae bacterium]|nr:PSD1 and planctomycete cytochrome C domain-containing protein [Planctomycetaceae bacterium]